MPRELVVFGYGDGRNRIIVAATTKKRARELLQISQNTFDQYATATGNKGELDLALANPEKLFMKPSFADNSQFVEAVSTNGQFKPVSDLTD